MTQSALRNHIYKEMEIYLETMCAYHATGNRELFRYYAGKADACRDILEEVYRFDERYASEHIRNMWEIMDENW